MTTAPEGPRFPLRVDFSDQGAAPPAGCRSLGCAVRRVAQVFLHMSLAVAACCSAGIECRSLSRLATPAGIQHPAELRAALESALEAQCTCSFPAAARQLFPLGVEGRETWEGVEEGCLRQLRVVSVSPGSDTLVAVYLAGGRDARRRGRPVYVMMAHFSDGEWVFSWPAVTGETEDTFSP